MAEKILSVQITGVDKVVENIQQYGAKAIQALAAEMVLEAERTMTESKKEVPVDTGALAASGTVRLPVIDESSITVEMGYGGPAVDYAVYVHEDLTKHHPNGNAKFLEGPFNRRAGGVAERIGKGMQRRLG